MKYEKIMSSRVFKDPTRRINDNYLKIDSYIKRLENKVNMSYKEKQTHYIELVTKLDTLSPLKTLTRGYCFAESDGKIIKSFTQLKSGEIVDLKFHDGNKQAKIL